MLTQNHSSYSTANGLSNVKTNDAILSNANSHYVSGTDFLDRRDEVESLESLDSLESEQPSSRSHAITSSSAFQNQFNNTNSNNNNPNINAETRANSYLRDNIMTGGGGGTYRQESPTVLMTSSSTPVSSQSVPGSANSVTTVNKPTSTSDTVKSSISFQGFQVVENQNSIIFPSSRGAGNNQQASRRDPTMKDAPGKISILSITSTMYLSRVNCFLTCFLPLHINMSISTFLPLSTSTYHAMHCRSVNISLDFTIGFPIIHSL